MDIDPAEMEFWLINGDVIIPQSNDQIHLKLKGMFIRQGSLTAGSP